MSGIKTSGATAAPMFHDVTGKYEFGKEASLILNLSLIDSAADVSPVALRPIRKVVETVIIVTKYFRDWDQFLGLPEFALSSLMAAAPASA